MKILRYLKRDRYNIIDFVTAIAVMAFVPTGGWQAAGYLMGANFLANVLCGTIIRIKDQPAGAAKKTDMVP